MENKIRISIAGIGAVILFILNHTYGLAWIVGWSSLIVLSYFREKYYSIILTEASFSVGKYIAYIVFVFVILWIPPVLAFMFPTVLNPYVLVSAYFIDRFILFVGRAFKKESVYVSK
ncbi:hypothetical protein ERUR111494_02225 [Erysipelothrix urinaevulpis]|uniref:hypothetical protein n=1 Tax=Erysipelothrix urinaevulpis TaxID=2683717 RepID=UPI001357A44A|nr:hypothetical protein [Erysipelothrix urinaevulpis]